MAKNRHNPTSIPKPPLRWTRFSAHEPRFCQDETSLGRLGDGVRVLEQVLMSHNGDPQHFIHSPASQRRQADILRYSVVHPPRPPSLGQLLAKLLPAKMFDWTLRDFTIDGQPEFLWFSCPGHPARLPGFCRRACLWFQRQLPWQLQLQLYDALP